MFSSYLPCQLGLEYQTLIAIINHGVNLDSIQGVAGYRLPTHMHRSQTDIVRRAYSLS